jgi:hypothetical protein
MAYSHVEIKNFSGLFLQPNTFNVPDGALEVCENAVIAQDQVISKRRGYRTFHTPSSGTLNNLFLYQNNLLALYNDKIVRLDSNGTGTNLSGETVAETGRTGRAAEQNNNLYFTSNNGVMKLTAYNSDVYKAGIPPALDLRGSLITLSTNILQDNYAVGYRVLFGIRDANKNLILGAPSDFLYVANTAGAARAVRLEFSVPTEITSTAIFYQIYRTSQVTPATDDPLPDFRLIKEANLTSSQITNGVVYFEDTVDDVFRDEAAELYTNPNSREGELQANERPPLCNDIVLFKDQMFYANCTSKHFIQINLIAPGDIAVADYVEVKQDPTTRRYVWRGGTANDTVVASVTGTTTLTGTTLSAHGYAVNDIIFVANSSGGTTPVTEGEYTVTGITATTFTFVANTGADPSGISVQALRNSSGYGIARLLTSGTVAQNLDTTARALVKAINRDDSSPVYARYLSSNADVPGQVLLQSKTFDSDPIQLRANTTLSGGAWSPPFPTTFGSSAQSDNAVLPNVVYVSKLGEPEAVPLVNQIIVGSKNKAILRIFALRDSLIVLKEDGVFRIDGDNTGNYQATIIDNTVFCLVASSAALLNNQVYFLSNQGICIASSTNVEILSRNIELPIQAVLGNASLATYTSGAAYESERLYLLTTLIPNSSTGQTVYCYNTITQAWTTWTTNFVQALVGPADRLFMISTANVVTQERKNQNKLDYADNSYSTTVVSIDPDGMGGVVTSASIIPQPGDVLVLSSQITRIKEVVTLGSNQYDLAFEFETTLEAANTPTLYRMFVTTIRTSPFHAGAVNRLKQFSQLQIHTRDKSITTMDITYSGDTFGSSELTTWRAETLTAGDGWGNQPWSLFPWGNEDTINLTYNTQPAPIIRTYIPLFAQRSSFIQVFLEHKMAAESLNIQEIGFQVRGLVERVSR